VVFQQWENGERLMNSDGVKMGGRLLNSGVSVVGKVKKFVEQWCFSNEERAKSC
jgi:ABC-type phosphonate transport system ATPase subunit